MAKDKVLGGRGHGYRCRPFGDSPSPTGLPPGASIRPNPTNPQATSSERVSGDPRTTLSES
jgi:hypothetical protein